MKKLFFAHISYRCTLMRMFLAIVLVMIMLSLLSGCLKANGVERTQAGADNHQDRVETIVSETLSPTPTSAPSPTPTNTPTPSPSPTATPTATPTPTLAPTNTPTPIPTNTPTPTPTTAPSDPNEVEGSFNSSYARDVLSIVNREREAAELHALTWNNDLEAAAKIRAQEIVILFSHTRPDGSSWSTVLPSYINYSGENLAMGQSSPQQVMNAWMDSEGHKKNILNEGFNQIGVACFESNGVLYWVQLFSS